MCEHNLYLVRVAAAYPKATSISKGGAFVKPKLPRVKVKVPPTKVIPNKKKDAPRDLGWDDGDIGAEDARRREKAAKRGYHYEDY